MIKIISETCSEDISKLSIGYFDVYQSLESRILIKELINKLFKIGDTMFFFFSREEDLTSDEELKSLRKQIIAKFQKEGEYKVLREIDSQRFDSVAMIRYDFSTPNFIIDLWKYFYSCNFFKPGNLNLDEYIHYLKLNGVVNIDGKSQLDSGLTEFMCIKGLGADYLIISYKNGSEVLESILTLQSKYPELRQVTE